MPIYGAGVGSRTNLSTLTVLNTQQPAIDLQRSSCNRLLVPLSDNPPRNINRDYEMNGLPGYWALGSGWSFSGGALVGTSATGHAYYGGWGTPDWEPPVIGASYDYRFEVSEYVSGDVYLYTGGVIGPLTANGVYTGTVTPSATEFGLYGSSFVGKVDRLSLVRNDVYGTAALSFAAIGTLSGAGVLAGTSPLSFAPTATLLGKGQVTGTSAVSFAPTATATGKEAVSGSTSLAFAPTATALLGRGSIAGSLAFSLVPTATITGRGQITGSASFGLTAIGTLTSGGWQAVPASVGSWANWASSSGIWTPQPPSTGTWH